MESKEAHQFAHNYIKFMSAHRSKTKKEIELHFIFLKEDNNQISCCLAEPPDPHESWDSLARTTTREILIKDVAESLPNYIMTCSEAWTVEPKDELELGAVLAFRRSHPSASLSDYPGSKEVINILLEGQDMNRFYTTPVNGSSINVQDIDDSVEIGMLQGIFKEGYELAFEGAIHE